MNFTTSQLDKPIRAGLGRVGPAGPAQATRGRGGEGGLAGPGKAVPHRAGPNRAKAGWAHHCRAGPGQPGQVVLWFGRPGSLCGGTLATEPES